MAGTLKDNALVYKQLTNRTCTQLAPHELIDGSTFTLDFTDRKYIIIGLDASNGFQVTTRIVTTSRYVNVPVDMLRRIYSMIGNILSVFTSQPVKSRERLFLKDENITLSKMSYRGDNMLVIESNHFNGARVMLSRENLLTLQELQTCIEEDLFQKIAYVQPIVMDQLEKIAVYLKQDFYLEQTSTVNEIATFIKGIHDGLITENLSKTSGSIPFPNYVSQIKRFASVQLADIWLRKLNEAPPKRDISPEPVDENDGPMFFNNINY